MYGSQCKKHNIVATSSTEAEYAVAANCCGEPHGLRRWISGFSSTLPGLGGLILMTKRSYWSHELGPPTIQATIDKTPYTITEDLVKSQLQLADDDGIDDLPIAKIYFGMDNLGTKSGSWDQFGSPLAVALICLSDERQFNWSSYIFKGMVSNIGNAKKFLMLNFEGHPMPLLAAMLSQDLEGEDFKHGQSSDLNIASFSRTHETDADPFTNVEDEPLGGSFHMSPPSSTQAPLAGQTSGGAEDLISLTALSSVVSTLVQKVNSLETELKDHKKLFKDVVGKLVKKVKAIEVKLRTTKRKIVVSDSDQEEEGKQDVDLYALLALANAAVTVDSNISPGGTSDNPAASTSVSANVPTSANVLTGSTSVPADVPTSVAPAGVSNKGKTPMVDEDITVKERTFKQMQADILGEQAAKRLHDEEQAQADRQRAELQRRRQQDVLASAMYYTKANSINIIAQVEANASLSKTLLGDDVSDDNFPARMSSAVYSTGWSMAYVKSFTDDQLKEEFEKIQKTISNIHIQAFSKTLKRICPVLKEPSSKRQNSIEAPIPSVHEVHQSPVISSPKSSATRRKSLGRKHLSQPKSNLKELDLDADDQTFIKVVSNEDSEDEAHLLWSALVGWEVLFDSHEGGKGSFVWQIQHLWQIRSWRLYTLSNVHVLETVFGEVVFMFADVSYPLLVKLMERMLTHKLEIDKDVVGNDMTTAEQLIRFIKNQLVAA
nr:aminoacyl-tRNA synthetase, class 1a, anticodon-binding [Tanacetum cinerariifolium]